jgi:hypothetical protein
MRYFFASLLVFVASVSSLVASPPPKPSKPAKKLSVIDVAPTADFSQPPPLAQLVRVRLKNIPSSLDPATSTDWRFIITNGNAPPALFQRGSDQEWTKTVVDANGLGQRLEHLTPASGQPLIQKTADPNKFDLTLPTDAITANTTSVQVSFGGAQAFWTRSPAQQSTSTSFFEAVSTQSEADNFLTGSYSPAIHSQPRLNTPSTAKERS